MVSKATLLRALEIIAEMPDNDPEASHCEADRLLVEYINDPEIARAYDAIKKWYA